ncbi:MAG: hypothetical protein ACOX52_03855 [Verrucomicrobiota bacterium]
MHEGHAPTRAGIDPDSDPDFDFVAMIGLIGNHCLEERAFSDGLALGLEEMAEARSLRRG